MSIELKILDFFIFDNSDNWEEAYFRWLEQFFKNDFEGAVKIIECGLAREAFKSMYGRFKDIEALSDTLAFIVKK